MLRRPQGRIGKNKRLVEAKDLNIAVEEHEGWRGGSHVRRSDLNTN
jgi:hypothetical protein